MKNSLIIKSGDANFESYYKNMIKRKLAQAMSNSLLNSMNSAANGQSPNRYTTMLGEVTSPRSGNVLFVRGKRPPARDGHTCVIVSDQWFVVFGGDRHHMPFNDLFAMDLEAEFHLKQAMFNK